MELTSHRPGTIIKIKACDFVSYRKLKFQPVTSLNILLAPNGAGKSSLLSAIILGLAGKPNIIGKNNQMCDYIMYGKEEAEIRIDLYDPESRSGVLSVSRLIRRNNTSAWSLNNTSSTLKQVEEAMKRLNIQVDNLCQVLPQERVHDFAKMNSLQLLDNIQRVLGDDLHSDYHQLLELRKSLLSINETIEKNTQQRQDQILKYQRLERDVAAIEEKKRVLKSVTLCRQKLAWTVCQQKQQQQLTVSGHLSEAKQKLDSFDKELEPLKKSLLSAERHCASVNDTIKNKKRSVSSVKERLQRLVSEMKTSSDEVEAIKERVRRRLADADNHQALVDDIDAKIHQLSLELTQHNDKELSEEVSCFDREMKEKTGELQALMHQNNHMKQEHVALTNTIRVLERRLEQANSVKERRLQMMATRSGDVYKAHHWLTSNKHLFHSNIYGPLLIELNINNAEGAKYVEFRIPYRDLTSFVTETSEDMTNLLRSLRDREKLAVNCAHCPPPHTSLHLLYPPPLSKQQLREIGFDCYLVELVEGPDTVLKHLCNLCKLHVVPVAFTSRTLDTAAIASHKISAYFLGNEFYRVKTSTYSKKSSTSVVKVGPSTLLADSIDKRLIHQTQVELNAKREAVGELELEMNSSVESKAAVESTLNTLRTEKRNLSLKLERYRNTTVRLRKHQEQRSTLVATLVDTRREHATAHTAIKGVLVKNRKRGEETVVLSRQYCEEAVKVKLWELQHLHHVTTRDATRQRLHQTQHSRSQLKEEVEEARRRLVEVKAEVSSLETRARELTEGLSPSDQGFTARYARAFTTLPEDVDSITAKIHSYEAKARCLHNPLHQQCMKDYEAAKTLAQSLSVELEKLTDRLDSVKSSFSTVSSRWLPRIQHLTSELNIRFSTFFQRMGCVGQISLGTAEQQEGVEVSATEEVGVERLGVEVRVKFRDETELQLLDQYVQSGGERALTTAVFLLSLQQLSSLPFRCIDEINQGMDQVNERRMYNLLFNTVSDGLSQYFLLTPKFLKNVSFPRMCAIFNIYNCAVNKLAKRNHLAADDDKENGTCQKRRHVEAAVTAAKDSSRHNRPMRSQN